MQKRPLFLKWVLINLFTILVIWLCWHFGKEYIVILHPVSKIMVGVVGLIAFVMTIYCGTLAWRTDAAMELTIPWQLPFLRHQSKWIIFAAEACPNVGLLGALLGFFVLLSTNLNVDISQFKEAVNGALAGLGIAFAPTITGVFFQQILKWQQHLVEHAIDGLQFKPNETL